MSLKTISTDAQLHLRPGESLRVVVRFESGVEQAIYVRPTNERNHLVRRINANLAVVRDTQIERIEPEPAPAMHKFPMGRWNRL